MIDANEFWNMVSKNKSTTYYKLGTIDTAHTSGSPKVTFDGESVVSTKTYTRLSSYTPTANDRVLLLVVGATYVILGKII